MIGHFAFLLLLAFASLQLLYSAADDAMVSFDESFDGRWVVSDKEDYKAEDFELPLIPDKTISNPDDKKPEDWNERAKIPYPNAVKPNDWDEDAPMEIVDEEAVKPKRWLDDEPKEIDDPEATKLGDWDDEEIVSAPGYREWKKLMKRNLAYKGKWSASLIDNPNYKGIWKPRDIPNPNYFELEKPDFEPLMLVVSRFGQCKMKKVFDVLYKLADIPFLSKYKLQILVSDLECFRMKGAKMEQKKHEKRLRKKEGCNHSKALGVATLVPWLEEVAAQAKEALSY
ncbi:hypothetical protein DITRI_Ditri07aG0049300 [Diplodiscus trichospermus]